MNIQAYTLCILCVLFGSDSVASVKNVLGRWGKSVGEATKKAEDLAGNTWQHCESSFFCFFNSNLDLIIDEFFFFFNEILELNSLLVVSI